PRSSASPSSCQTCQAGKLLARAAVATTRFRLPPEPHWPVKPRLRRELLEICATLQSQMRSRGHRSLLLSLQCGGSPEFAARPGSPRLAIECLRGLLPKNRQLQTPVLSCVVTGIPILPAHTSFASAPKPQS